MNSKCQDAFVTTREAKKTLGVTDTTLRGWADTGLIPSIRTPKGQRLYNVGRFLGSQNQKEDNKEQQKICYCRVSSASQKDDLHRQVLFMSQAFPDHKIITDIGSGINFRRKGLTTLLDIACKGLVSQVVVAYRDRLCRFAFELVERVLSNHQVKLLVLNQSLESSENGELAEDLLAIINVFNCRVNGRRKYQTKKAKDNSQEAT